MAKQPFFEVATQPFCHFKRVGRSKLWQNANAGGVFYDGVFGGGVFVVVLVWWCGGVFVVVFLWWCLCGGVVVFWWCFGVF